MKNMFADRMSQVHKSFIREILKVTEDPEIISFAGGLPSPNSFPVEDVARAAQEVLREDGCAALQYSTTEGYLPLREFISARYAKKGIDVSPDEILITNGSQQGLDLAGKAFLNKADSILVERPTYLAAIQSFGLFEPEFRSVPLLEDGADISALEDILRTHHPKLFYSVPNFQNPTGITYSEEKRRAVADLMNDLGGVFIEDDPYGELRFKGQDIPSMKKFLGDRAIVLGTFSKVVSPGMRLGWICASQEIMEKLLVAKQASDLHSSCFVQRIVHRYLIENDMDGHIAMIKQMYGKQRDAMVQAMEDLFPGNVQFTRPEGGMFLWVTLPEKLSSMKLFDMAIKEKVAFVPGQAFFVDGGGANTMRLNYSNSDEEKIVEGIGRMAKALRTMI